MTDLITPCEAAEILGFRPVTLRRWADRGVIDCVRSSGGHRRFHRSDVLELLKAMKKNAKIDHNDRAKA